MEKRLAPREDQNVNFRVYTSIARVAYTLETDNVSSTGAFLKTRLYPEVGEIITFDAIDRRLQRVYTGHAKVKWVHRTSDMSKSGFGIEFTEKLDREIIKKLQ